MSGLNLAQVIEELRYVNYAANRDACPAITPESWKKVYGPEVDEWEPRYLAAKAIAKARYA